VIVRIGATSAVLTFAGVALSRWLTRPSGTGGAGVPWSATHALPNADAQMKPVPGTRPELTPVEKHYRIDINLAPPMVREAAWRLRFSGLVSREREFTLEELRDLPSVDQFVTLSCISNPVGGDLIGTTRWTGVSVSRVLDEVGMGPEATFLKLSSADGFDEIVSIEEARKDPRVMLAYAWDGLPLTPEHGFPLRIYLPGRYGMKQPKWIERIEALPAWEPGYWVRRGWDRDARMKSTSVIDVVGPEAVRNARGELILPVGGISHAGDRGISRVEVRVDGGDWAPAQLRTPISETTWMLWRYEWPFREGHHSFEVRCFDGKGNPQIAAEAPPHPSGAAGIQKVTRDV
jgi:DMSO/TMAO reductase YedYZ molybdopterin-dependent catalytic subunit